MRRSRTTLGVAATAVALFAAGGILFVWLVDGSAARRREPVDTPAAAEPAPVEPARALARASPGAPPATADAEVVAAPTAEATALVPEQVDPAWSRVRVATRIRELGAVASDVNVGLIAAREDMSHCFAAEPPEARPPVIPKGDDENWVDPAVLLLYLEARQGFIDVAEVTVESLGTESPQVVSCCREVLRGHEIPSLRAVPGQRYRVRFELY